MDIIVFTFNAVIPLFIMIAVGYMLRIVGLMPEDIAVRINKVCFAAMLPCHLFNTIYKADLRATSFGLVGYAALCYTVIVPILCWFVPKLTKSRSQAGAVIQASYRSNMVLIGLALMTNLFGADNAVPMALLVTFIVPYYTVISIVVLAMFSENNEGKKLTAADVAIKICKNPLTVSAIIGIALNLSRISLPLIVTKPISDLSSIASPLAMMALGARFNFKSLSANRAVVAFASVFRLVIMPAIMVGGGILLGYRGPELCALFICAGSPMAVSAVAMADAMGCDGELSGEIMVTTSLLSCFTLFVGLCALQMVGLM